MPTYLTPGVYVEEVPSANKPIEGVGTSVAAFVGLAPGGPVNKPMRIANWGQFARLYGDPVNPENGPFMEGTYLAHSVYGFFQNGGGLCWVVRVGGGDGNSTAQAALPSASDASLESFRAVALVAEQVSLELTEEPAAPPEEGKEPEPPTYKLVVTAGSRREEHDGLTLKKGRSYIVTKVNAASTLVQLEDLGGALPEAARAPATGSYALAVPSAPPQEITAADFAGDVARREGMGGLAAVDEITMLLVPDVQALSRNGDDAGVRDIQGKMIAHCEVIGGCMTILDPPPGLSPQDVFEWRMNVAGFDSKMATLYYPWIEVMDPISNRPLLIPPSGHVAGVWARTDATRGVHKAPANEVVMGCNGLAFQITQSEQGSLNQNGINCIRAFPGRGIRVWGARTLSSDPEWRYVNVRRLFNYLSSSIINGTQWAVFEPNDMRLWLQLRIACENFLTRMWRDGALFGAIPDEAFFVRCDSETNPPEVIEAGQVVIEIGIAPVKPAEFVIFRISQFAAGASEVS
jgi:phage tail sheath protein FI